ncbi:MAG TPA: SDR family NAD(P)-dependent oxidoreductase [Aggregatilineales bacterium]|nr:SDR family NAD(P)-dependent oxidoreductase [Aggregatilineales bacterium]
MTHFLITGASRGLGALLSDQLPSSGDQAWLVSRSEPNTGKLDGVTRRWIEADLGQPGAAQRIASTLGESPLDVLIYNAGIWESNAFSSSYRLEDISLSETMQIMQVNLTSAILSIQALLPNLRRSASGKIIVIGSINGLENYTQGREVAYGASKFGLRGMTHALRENLRADRIAVTCVNPGSFGSYWMEGGRLLTDTADRDDLISTEDMVNTFKWLVTLSNRTCAKEIDLPAMLDAI